MLAAVLHLGNIPVEQVCVCVCVCVCIMNYMEILISYVSDISITWDREENAILDKNGPVNNKLHKQLIFP